MIYSFELLVYCLISGAAFLLIFDLLWSKFESYVPTLEGFPKELVEKKSPSWFISQLIIEFVFFVLMPTIIYDWFYTMIPFSGIRGGVAVGLFAFFFGMVPFAILHMFRIKMPAVYMLYQLLGLLLKIVGTMTIIGYLYSL